MPDREWFIISPDPNGGAEYTNFESADVAAQRAVAGSLDEVYVVRCTAARVRSYKRTVTIVAEDMSTDAPPQT